MPPKHLGYGTDDEGDDHDHQEARSETPFDEDYDAPGSAQQRSVYLSHTSSLHSPS